MNKIMVAVKRVLDFNVKPRVKSDGSGIDLANAKMSMNPFDEIAVEEAVRLKEAGTGGEVVALACGIAACQEMLRTALAIGADRAILVQTDAEQAGRISEARRRARAALLPGRRLRDRRRRQWFR